MAFQVKFYLRSFAFIGGSTIEIALSLGVLGVLGG
jgi:hypothetical protein